MGTSPTSQVLVKGVETIIELLALDLKLVDDALWHQRRHRPGNDDQKDEMDFHDQFRGFDLWRAGSLRRREVSMRLVSEMRSSNA